MHLKIINTQDGSDSLYDGLLNESYHSKFGAINESMHVFIEAGFNGFQSLYSLNLLEIGLGTGLNALLSCLMSEVKNIHVTYFALEPYPIGPEIYKHLNFSNCLDHTNVKTYFHKIHNVPWGDMEDIHSHFKICKLKIKIEDFQPQDDFFNLVYFDAFSPEVQPKIWEISNFVKLFQSMRTQGILVTYCAKGKVRRNLSKVGFKVERLPGPKGKREMLRATK